MRIEKVQIPTAAQLLSSNLVRVENNLMAIATENNLADYERVLQDMYQKGFDPHLLAACLLKSTLDQSGISLKPEKVREPAKPALDHFPRGGEKNGGDFEGSPKVRLHLGLGKKDKIKPGDIVGAITGECKIPGNDIGVIDMFDHFSYFEVSENHVRKVLKNMKKNTIKGKKVMLSIARN